MILSANVCLAALIVHDHNCTKINGETKIQDWIWEAHVHLSIWNNYAQVDESHL